MSQFARRPRSRACCLPRMPQPMMATVTLSLARAGFFSSAAISECGVAAAAAAAVARIESSRNWRRVMFDITGSLGMPCHFDACGILLFQFERRLRPDPGEDIGQRDG